MTTTNLRPYILDNILLRPKSYSNVKLANRPGLLNSATKLNLVTPVTTQAAPYNNATSVESGDTVPYIYYTAFLCRHTTVMFICN